MQILSKPIDPFVLGRFSRCVDMLNSQVRPLCLRAIVAGFLVIAAAGACATAAPEVESPVVGATRTQLTLKGQYGDTYVRQGEDGLIVAKVLAPAPQVWEALVAAMERRKVTPTVFSRAIGRIGDTSLVMMRQWNGKQVSHYLSCGSSMTGQRANDDRIRAVLLAQISRLVGDTLGVAVHLSGTAFPIASGASGSTAHCQSTGRGEAELLDEVLLRVGKLRQ